MNKLEIIPAILPKDFVELEEKVSLIHGLAKNVQIDICDGQFVPNSTWPYKKKDNNFQKLLDEQNGLPFWQDIDYEFDLMVNHANEIVEEWLRVGANRIILHLEMKGDLDLAIEKIHGLVEIGLALNIDTPIDLLDKYLDKIQFIQCMGIDHIGFQGQEFDNEVVNKIKKIKSKYPNLLVSVDGGVSLKNASNLIEAGANRLVVGSAIFDSDNVFEAIKNFNNI